jgi:hypothetical protein
MSNPKNNLLKFLESSGALVSGNPERIKAAKREYRRQYMAQYLRDYRNRRIPVRCMFTKEELTELDRGARAQGARRTTFLKLAAFSYMRKNYLVPNGRVVGRLEQQLSIAASDLRELARRTPDGILGRHSQLMRLTQRVEELERAVTTTLRSPEELTDFVRRRQVEDPDLTRRLRELLDTC